MGNQILPIPSIVSLAKIVQYISSYDVTLDTALNGGSLNSTLPREIYQTRKNVEWMYSQNPSDSNLVFVGDYLYALCGKYISKAKTILGSQGGIPINPSISTNTYAFSQLILTVDGASGSPVAGTYVYQNAALIQAAMLYQITLNKTILYDGQDFTFDAITGTITFVSYVWNTGDVAVLTFDQKVN
jgi:hypothetical protein